MKDWTKCCGGRPGRRAAGGGDHLRRGGQGLLPGAGGGSGDIRGYLLGHPELVAEMTDRPQKQQDAADQVKAAAAMKKIGIAPFFDPKHRLRHRPRRRQEKRGGILRL